MAKYMVKLIFDDGSEYMDDTVLEAYEDAEDYAMYLCSCCKVGADVLHCSNPGDNPETGDDVEADYEIIEID